MADGFLGRWARRKEAVRKGEQLPPEPVVAPVRPSPQPAPASASASGSLQSLAPSPPRAEEGEGGAAEGVQAPPPPTLEDVESLTPASDFSRYVRPDVTPEVKNAAMKKLFSDPHFNVMDRLDIYIDDYSKPDPIPPQMLRQLASAKFLKLFDDEEQENAGKALTGREVVHGLAPQTVAQSSTAEAAVTPAPDHADPDLRLQQDDAPGPPGPGTRS